MDIRQSAIDRTKRFEGSKDHFYLDTKSNVTVGVGHLLADSASTGGIRMLRKLDGKVATKQEKVIEWTGVDEGTIGEAQTTLRMEDPEIDRLLSDDLTQSASDLTTRFPSLDSYPESAQDALLDMMFNLGLTKFRKANWKNLFAAVESEDWKEAATESHRKDVQQSRNDEIKQLFLDAAAPVVVVPLRDIQAASTALMDNVVLALRAAAKQMDAHPKLFQAGINRVVVEAHAGAFSLKVELQGPEKVSGTATRRTRVASRGTGSQKGAAGRKRALAVNTSR